MNKREVLEIKKQYSPINCTITRICGCYVDGEKNIKAETKEAFLSLPEEDTFKYFEILRKGLSGKVGRNQFNLEFPLESEKDGGQQEFLLQLRNSKLKDNELLDEFYGKIINYYDCSGNYLILLIHCVYDVPGKGTDGKGMYDASEEVYEYIHCCICPVDLSKPGLSYFETKNTFQNRIRDWVVGAPDIGFLFPAFNERSADIHSTLYFSKKTDEIHEEVVTNVLGCKQQIDSDCQKEMFNSLIEEVLNDECTLSVVKNIYENITEKIEENRDMPEPLTMDKYQIKKLFEESGVEEESLKGFDQAFDEIIGKENSILADNVVNEKIFEIKMQDVVLRVSSGHTDLVETKIIDDKYYLLIAIKGDIEADKIRSKAGMRDE